MKRLLKSSTLLLAFCTLFSLAFNNHDAKSVMAASEYTPGEGQDIGFLSMFDGVYNSSDGWIRTHDLADYTIAHGTYTSYEPMVKKEAGEGVYILGSEDKTATAEGWRLTTGYNDGVIYVVEAKAHMFAKLVEPAGLRGWIDDPGASTTVVIAKLTETSETKIVDGPGIRGNFQCDYVELRPTERLVFEFKFQWDGTRDINGEAGVLPTWNFAPAVGGPVDTTKYIRGEEKVIPYGTMFNGVYDSSDGWIHTNLVDYTIAHGSRQSYEPMVKKQTTDGSLLLGSEDKTATANGWQLFTGYNDAVLYVVKANAHMYASLVEPANLGGWVDENCSSTMAIVKYGVDSGIEIISEGVGMKGNFNCDYVKLSPGDRLVFEYKFQWNDQRNIQIPPYWKFAQAITEEVNELYTELYNLNTCDEYAQAPVLRAKYEALSDEGKTLFANLVDYLDVLFSVKLAFMEHLCAVNNVTSPADVHLMTTTNNNSSFLLVAVLMSSLVIVGYYLLQKKKYVR